MFSRIKRLFKGKEEKNLDEGVFCFHDGVRRRRIDATRLALRLETEGLDIEKFFMYSKGFSELMTPAATESQQESLTNGFIKAFDEFSEKMRKVFDLPEVESGGLATPQIINLASDWILYTYRLSEKSVFFTNSFAQRA